METIKNPPGDYKIVYVILTNATFIHLQHSAIVKHSKDRLAEFYKYRQRAFDNPSDLEAITQSQSLPDACSIYYVALTVLSLHLRSLYWRSQLDELSKRGPWQGRRPLAGGNLPTTDYARV